MDLTTLRNEIQIRADDTSLTDAKTDRWVNQGIKQWANRADWPSLVTTYELDTTVASTVEYSLEDDFKKMIGMRVGASAGETELDATEYSFINYKNKNVSSTGPWYYLNPSNAKYGLVPTPTTTGLPIYYKYYKIPADLTTGTEEPPFPENYHELVVFFALKKYWESNDEFDKVLFYDAEYENTIERMKSDLLVRATGQLDRMKDVRELVGTDQPQKINAINIGKN